MGTVYAPDFPADLLGPAPLDPLQECQSHLAHEAPLQTACQRLQHELQAACTQAKVNMYEHYQMHIHLLHLCYLEVCVCIP